MGIRSFVAINLPSRVKERVDLMQKEWGALGPHVRWVAPENVHITLKFLGDVAEERVAAIGDALGGVAARVCPFDFTVTSFGVFPDLRYPRIVWLGIGEGADRVAALQLAVEAEMESLGFAPEKRAFRPHVTVGRMKSPRGRSMLGELLQTDTRIDERVEVSEMFLMRSQLRPTGPIYSVLRAVSLEGEGGGQI
jgi:2'-5' RNA ligase